MSDRLCAPPSAAPRLGPRGPAAQARSAGPCYLQSERDARGTIRHVEVRCDDHGRLDDMICHGVRVHFQMLDNDAAMLRVGDVHLTICAEGGALRVRGGAVAGGWELPA